MLPKLNLHRFFVVSDYSTNEAQLPNTCPDGLHDGVPCKISLNHKRIRKTGPDFVLVVRCETHSKAFTIYPPGYVPYGRSPLAGTVAPDGNLVILDGNDTLEAFRGTVFDAAVDAASDKVWPKNGHEEPAQKHFNTQLHQIIRSIVTLGLSPEQALQRELVTEILNVPGQSMYDNAAAMLDPKLTFRDAGQAVCNILEMLSSQAQTGLNIFMQLAICGHLAGLWPPLHWWCPKIGKLLSVDRHNFSTFNTMNIPP